MHSEFQATIFPSLCCTNQVLMTLTAFSHERLGWALLFFKHSTGKGVTNTHICLPCLQTRCRGQWRFATSAPARPASTSAQRPTPSARAPASLTSKSWRVSPSLWSATQDCHARAPARLLDCFFSAFVFMNHVSTSSPAEKTNIVCTPANVEERSTKAISIAFFPLPFSFYFEIASALFRGSFA